MNPYLSPDKVEVDKELIVKGLKSFKDSLILHRDGLQNYLDKTKDLINDLDLTHHKPISIFELISGLVCTAFVISFIFLVGVLNGIEQRDFWLNLRDKIRDSVETKAPLNPR